MSRKKINLNYKIKNLEERSEYLEKQLDIDSRSRKKWIIPSKAFNDTNGGMDYYLESAASYLLRSKDVDSPKDLEYSYFIDRLYYHTYLLHFLFPSIPSYSQENQYFQTFLRRLLDLESDIT